MIATIMMALGLIFWFYVIRWVVRLGLKHPQQSMALLRGAGRLIRR